MATRVRHIHQSLWVTRGRYTGSLENCGRKIRDYEENCLKGIVIGRREVDAMKDIAFLSVSATRTSKTKGMSSTKPAIFRYQCRLTPYHSLKHWSRWASPTTPSTWGDGAVCRRIFPRRSPTRSSLLAKSLSREIVGNWSHTTLALALPDNPRNWRTHSRRGRSGHRLGWRRYRKRVTV